jgi:hypothetical protein
MKKVFFTLFLALSALFTSVAQNELPEKATIFLEAHFSNSEIQKISRVERENVNVYHVILKDKTQVEFDQTGAWSKIEYKKAPQSISYLPEPMQQELSKSKKINKVKAINTDGFDIQVELKNKKHVKGNRFGEIKK